jgi:poly(hydroxyalkanoate) depolymerase family esterase
MRLALFALVLFACSPARAALTEVPSFGTNPAALKMYKYVPKDMPAGPRPLVVVLHGCSQTAAQYESAGWNELADARKFYVLYPEQNRTKNNSMGCFNWGGRWPSAPSGFVLKPEPLDLSEIARGHGENQSIKEMVDAMKAAHPVDAQRVYVTGLSAGGAMTAVLLATWPDVFRAGAIFAGVPYGCATVKKTTEEAFACMKNYDGQQAYLARDAKAWGDLVRAAAPGFSGPWPRVSIWHGTSDTIVGPKNQAELVKQWSSVHGTLPLNEAEDQVAGFPHKVFKDGSGRAVLETFSITGQGHGTMVSPQEPVDPDSSGAGKCGKIGAFILGAGICSTYHAARFFGIGAPGDPEDGKVVDPPVTTPPAGGATDSPREASGCSVGHGGAMWPALLLVLGLVRRRR